MTHDIRRWLDAVRTLCEAVDLTNVYRDASGKPKMFYHGTVDDFAEFDPKKVHDREGVSLKLGFGSGVLYFTDNPDEANQYATRRNMEGANIRPVYLIMRKPFRIKHWDDKASAWLNAAARGYQEYAAIKSYAARMRRFVRDLRADGYDSIVLGSEHVVFDANQVISTIAAHGDDAGQRLGEGAAAVYLYHGTAQARLPGIRYDGLLPAEKSRWSKDPFIGNHSIGKIHFVDSFDRAVFYAREASKTRPAILRVPRQAITDLQPDSHERDGAFYSERSVAPEHIERWNGKGWIPLVRGQTLGEAGGYDLPRQLRPWLTGRCFDFALALSERMPNAEFIAIGSAKYPDHVALRWNGRYYDARGEMDEPTFLTLHRQGEQYDAADITPISRDEVELHAGVAGFPPPYKGNRDIAEARRAVREVFGK